VLQKRASASRAGRVYRRWQQHVAEARGMGITVLTTTKGVLSDREARARKLGGEVLLEVY
jgi:small subunit ribosomal protein S8